MTPKAKKTIFALAAILVISGIAAMFYVKSPEHTRPSYLTEKVKSGDIRSVIMATGKIQPVTLVKVGTQISGTLKELYVDYNSVVKKGQLIAVIDPSVQEADISGAKAALATAEAAAREAGAALAHAEKDVCRSRELYRQDIIARSALEADESRFEQAKARFEAAGTRAAEQRAALLKARLQLGYTKIYSPVGGVVVTKNVDVGQTVAASFNTPTIAEIAEDLSSMQVAVNIDEADIGRVHIGQRAEFTVDAFPDDSFGGEVSQIRISPITENNVTSYTAIVSFENSSGQRAVLMPGMTANVTLTVEERLSVLTLPNSALRFRPPVNKKTDKTKKPDEPDEPDKSSVYKLVDGKPIKISVKTGITDGTNTEVIEGLKEGTEVITEAESPED